MHDLCYTLLRDFVTLGAADIAITSYLMTSGYMRQQFLGEDFDMPLKYRLAPGSLSVISY